MNNILEYKGYYTKIEFSVEDRVLFGKIEGIKDLVNFECDNLEDIEKEFHCAVDDYLALCKDLGEDLDKPYRGVFNVRISPDLHRKAAIAADKRGETLNSFVANAIKEALTEKHQTIMLMPVPERTVKDYVQSGFGLPKRCDKCNRLFWLEPYWVYYKEVGIEHYSLKQIKCKNHGERKGGDE